MIWISEPRNEEPSLAIQTFGRSFKSNNIDDSPDSNQWPEDFREYISRLYWLTYRTDFEPIASTPTGPSPHSLKYLIRGHIQPANAFTSDIGWGCMVRSSQCLLAACLSRRMSELRVDNIDSRIMQIFADHPNAPASFHSFAEFGTSYGKNPGEWFGPAAAARCIQRICSEKMNKPLIKVYVASDGGDIVEQDLMAVSFDKNSAESFFPTLVLVGLRLGIEAINPMYWKSLSELLSFKLSVGIAGGRPASSHYFYAAQGNKLFYLDPHFAKPRLPYYENLSDYTDEDLASVRTDRINNLDMKDMDPSMLVGFYLSSAEDCIELKHFINESSCSKILHVSERSVKFSRRGSTIDGFIDLGVDSAGEYECEEE
ncbi:hypothetical protein CANCADRAFT_22222, partial [Tortispora caseinolytica NRRL Y-17796]